MEISEDHAFRKLNNIAYPITEDCFPDTEIIKVLVEKELINIEELQKEKPSLGTVVVTGAKKYTFNGLVMSLHIDTNLLTINVKRFLKIKIS